MIDDFNAPRPQPKQPAPGETDEQPSEMPFRPPEEVANDPLETSEIDPVQEDSGELPPPSSDESLPAAKPRRGTPTFSKKRLLIIGAVILVLLIAGGVSWWLLRPQPVKPTPTAFVRAPIQKVTPAPTTVASDLSGLQVNPALNKLPVTGVMIENSLDARPQSGLGSASVVFEAVAEGGITRFLALFQDTSPSNVGPIRSVRPYYLQWALGFDAAIAHVGGSPDALADIGPWGVRDLDEFYNGGSYHRITTRAAPHNVYTSIADLNQLEDSKGYTSSTFTSWPRKPDAPAKTPTAATINLTLSGSDYNVVYTYAPTTNTYNRAEGGAPMIDANTNTQISPKVVIAIVVPETQGALDASGAYYSDYQPLGSGVAYVFQDGTVEIGTWSKATNTAQITFQTSSGAPIALDAGQTWVTAVTSTSAVTYTP